MIRIIADENIPFLQGVLEPYAEVIYLPGVAINKKTVLNADALLVRTLTKCNSGLLDGTKLRFIGTATIGFDHIDTAYCEDQKITWTNAPGCNASSVQQYICSALFTIAVKHGITLQGKVLGIIGVGNVGKKVENLGHLLGMKVLLNDPPRERVEGPAGFSPLGELLEVSDFLSLHVPLNRTGPDRTLGLIDRTALGKIKKDAWLINSSRGEVIEEAAILTAIESKPSPGLVIDVWNGEPEVNRSLIPGVFLATPHIAGYSAEGKANGTSMIVRKTASFFDLPLKEWYPPYLPAPLQPDLTIDCDGQKEEEILGKAVLHSYPILQDDLHFRQTPENFELLRKHYPTRREYPAFHVHLKSCPAGIAETLNLLGFSADTR
jgi:erythronate-4-phosphate dehydrogenase